MEVQQATRGLEALNAIKASPPDLLILDAMLPELHGFDITQKVKSSERYSRIPIVMVSSVYRGWRIAEDLKTSYRIEAFLEKPFKINTLWTTVERVLAAKPPAPKDEQNMAVSAYRAYKVGLERYQGDDIAGAIESFKEGLRIDPLSAKLHFQLGVLYLKRRGMVYQAMHAFEEAVRLAPDFFTAMRALAILYQRKGFKNKAIDMWERAIRACDDQKMAGKMRKHLLSLI